MNKLENVLTKKRLDLGENLNDFLEKEVKISRPTYDALMKKTHGYSAETIQKVSAYLGVKPSEALTMLETEMD
jgi:transcriptional regulator with XRE-family HTH domain